MIGRTNAGGGGGGKATVTINAPKGSTVSWTGAESGSVNLGSVTQATVTLKAGTYSFSCSLVLDGTATTIFTRTAAVTKGSVVNMYPDGAVFWYGMIHNEGSWNKLGSGFTLTENETNILLTWGGGTASTTGFGVITPTNSFDFSNYTKINFTLKCTKIYNISESLKCGYYSAVPTGYNDRPVSYNTNKESVNTMETVSHAFSGVSTAVPGIHIRMTSFELYAIWLE